MSDPMPTITPYGAADWVDYDNNWRQLDAEWLQSRGILRYQTAAQRDSAINLGGLGSAPLAGQFVYNQTEDGLEMRSKDGTWKPYRSLPVNTKAVTDTTSLVKLAHTSSGDKGISLSPTTVSTDLPFTVLGGILTVSATDVAIKTGVTTVKLTTDATSLVSDKPISAPSVTLTGTGTVLTATGKTAAVGTLTATTVTGTTITASGALTGGVGSSINGVNFATNYIQASSGYVSNAGYFNGDANGAFMRQRNTTTGVTSDAYIQVLADEINVVGTVVDFAAVPRVMAKHSIQFFNADNSALLGYSGPVIYTATNLVAADYPVGTIWVEP